MEKSTKERIMDEAVRCFNEKGYANTSLQEVARELGISRGNLAYHFPSKEVLLEAILQQMNEALDRERSDSRTFPSFQNLRKDIALYRKFQQEYAFMFTDSHVMSMPNIKKILRQMANKTIEDNLAAIAFALKVGNMHPEPFPGAYRQLAVTTWMLMFFWLPQRIIRGKASGSDPEKAVWSMILPHFTEKGVDAFRKYYGEEFYENLGPAFAYSLDDIVML